MAASESDESCDDFQVALIQEVAALVSWQR
jgi:hypothetical protein